MECVRQRLQSLIARQAAELRKEHAASLLQEPARPEAKKDGGEPLTLMQQPKQGSTMQPLGRSAACSCRGGIQFLIEGCDWR